MASVVQLSGSATAIDLRLAVQSPLPQVTGMAPETADRSIAEALRTLVTDHRLKGRPVVACLGSDEIMVETVRLPLLPPEEIARAAQWEASERLSLPIEQMEVRYLVAGEVRQENTTRQEVILIACPKELIRRRLKVLETAGLTPVGLDIEPCAFLRSLQRAQGTSDVIRMAYLYCSETSVTLMFAEGSRILFLKSIPMGGRQFDNAVAQSLGIELDDAREMRSDVFSSHILDGENEVHRSIIDALRPCFESIIDEIELCLRYHKVTFRGRPLDGLVMSGSESAPWLAEYFSDRVGLVCRPVTPLDGIHGTPAAVQKSPGRWATPLGLAMKRLISGNP